jgi:hypothetical protein
MLPLPLPDAQGRTVMLMRNGVITPDVKIVDMIKVNMMMSDILLEENDRMIVCGSVGVLDHENSSWAFMVQMTPAIVKKMTTLFQVRFAQPTLAINYPWHCYIFKGTSTCTECLAEICSLEI